MNFTCHTIKFHNCHHATARDTINQLLDDEHETDVTTLMKWTSEVDTFEEDIFTLLKFHHQDSVNIKEHHLKLERCREKVGQCKKVCTFKPTIFRNQKLN